MPGNRVIDISAFPTFTAINVLSDGGYDAADRVIPNCCRVTFNWQLADGKIGHNVLYGQVVSTFNPTQSMANSLFGSLTAGFWTAFAGHLSTGTQFLSLSLTDMRTANSTPIPSTSAAVAGTGGAISLPNEVALVVTQRTARSGRSFRGRTYIAGYDTAQTIAGNVASATCVSDTQAWFTGTVPAAFTSQGLTFCLGLFHRLAYTTPKGVARPERPATTIPITSSVVRDNHWDTIRRRGLK